MRDCEENTMRHVLQELPLDRVVCPPQVRENFDAASLAKLSQSLASVGQQVPILVEPPTEKGWPLVDGERRVREAMALKWKTISAIVLPESLPKPERVVRQLVVNIQRNGLQPLERAMGIESLMKETGWSAADVAARVGISAASVSRLRSLLLLPINLQRRIDDGSCAADTAYQIAKVANPAERALLAEQAMRGELTRDAAASHGRRAAKSARKPRGSSAVKRQRLIIALDQKWSLAIAGPTPTIAEFMAWAEQLIGRLRTLPATEMSLAEAIAALNASPKAGGA
jgi:ParB family chromosome partitioning protein